MSDDAAPFQVTDIDLSTGNVVVRDATPDDVIANQAILSDVAAIQAIAAQDKAAAMAAIQQLEQQQPGLVALIAPIIKAAGLNLPIGDGL